MAIIALAIISVPKTAGPQDRFDFAIIVLAINKLKQCISVSKYSDKLLQFPALMAKTTTAPHVQGEMSCRRGPDPRAMNGAMNGSDARNNGKLVTLTAFRSRFYEIFIQ